MNSLVSALRRLAHILTFASLVEPAFAGAAPVRRAKTSTAAPKPVVANNTIILLPLTPIVPTAQRLCMARTTSGLGYTILREGAGPKPTDDATVLVNYVGYLAATGVVFDQAMRSPLPVQGVIPGFSEALRMMGRTGVGRFCIPAALGYGATASGPIPANSELVFQVEVLDFRTATEMEGVPNAPSSEPQPPERD